MTGLLILIPVALGLGLTGLAAFFWSVRDGQYDDMDGAALRVLVDDSDGPLPFKPQSEQSCLRFIYLVTFSPCIRCPYFFSGSVNFFPRRG